MGRLIQIKTIFPNITVSLLYFSVQQHFAFPTSRFSLSAPSLPFCVAVEGPDVPDRIWELQIEKKKVKSENMAIKKLSAILL